MQEPTIKCPDCGTEIKLTDSLAGPLLDKTRQEFEDKLNAQKKAFQSREQALEAKEAALSASKASFEKQLEDRLNSERARISDQEKEKAKRALKSEFDAKSGEVDELKSALANNNQKLAEAQKMQAEVTKKERLLEDQKRELDLTVEQRVQQSVAEVRAQAKTEAEGTLKLKVSEKEEQIHSMQKQIEELRRKAEQGSQQLQGEVLELQLEQELRTKFPHDQIEPVAKGELGGDILQVVNTAIGSRAGGILWETKRTKNWSDGWLAKLRDDQRRSKAEFSILVSGALPKGVDGFGLVDGVWVAAPRYGIPVAIALRQTLIEVAKSKQARVGQDSKMEQVYDYLTGPKFKHRVEAIVEKFTDMQQDLDKERKAMTRLWAKRERQIESVIESTVGMYGDLQGIAGQAIKDIEGLDLPLLGDD